MTRARRLDGAANIFVGTWVEACDPIDIFGEAYLRNPPDVGEVPTQQSHYRHNRRNPMPLIQVRVIKGVFSKEQKRQMIGKLTDAMVSIEGENMRGVTWCVVEEVESGDWGIGGNALTTEDVHALARGKAA
jgi:4-oxalocrotonate tautomerase